ncbi:hypothetical protein RB653_007972 [Dictyostelium firmibasis]|uniref:Uncharacterized protein n=1 Tax=Dictyostelium firmibasis TaxID=79012 RepID=A0AAN7TMP5_9MYCE
MLIPEYLNTSLITLETHASLLHESLYFVLAPTIIQEVQAFRKYLLQKRSSTVKIGYIFVLVPSIDEYRDAFMQVFHSDQKAILQFWPKSKMEMSAYESESELLSWISLLFGLLGMKRKQTNLRKGSYALMNLAFHPLTLRALFAEEAESCEGEFRRYLEKLGLDWYISSAHLAREMEAKGINLIYESEIGDFSSIKEKKIGELIGQSADGESATLLHREMSNAFISLALFFESCDALWTLPISPDRVQKIEEWISPLQQTESLFPLLEEAIEMDDLEAFEVVISRFVDLSHRFPEVKMSFDWFTDSFQRELFEEISNRQQLRRFTGHIIISDRESFDSIPCAGVAILGAGHDQFPHVTREHLLSHLTKIAPTVLHDPSSIDKQLFLEQLLSSSSWFYCNINKIMSTTDNNNHASSSTENNSYETRMKSLEDQISNLSLAFTRYMKEPIRESYGNSDNQRSNDESETENEQGDDESIDPVDVPTDYQLSESLLANYKHLINNQGLLVKNLIIKLYFILNIYI